MATRAIARRRRTVYMKRVGHRRKSMTVSLAMVGGFIPLLSKALSGYRFAGIEGAGRELTIGLTGYNPQTKKWSLMDLAEGVGPIIGGALVHKLANRVGINRMLAKSGIPLLRI